MVILAAAKVGGIHANATWPADFLYDNLALELIAATARHNVTDRNSVLGDVNLGEVSHLPPTLTIDAVDLFAPVALLVSYAAAVPFGVDELEHGIEVGLFYSGLQHLNLGAAVASTIGAEESIFYAQLRLAHYW